jgi:rod shape-determining protein MreC
VFKSKTAFMLRILIIGALLFFMAHRFFFFAPGILEQGASLIMYPFLRLQNMIVKPVQCFLTDRHSIAQLEKTVVRLRAEKKDLLAEVIALHSTIWYQENIKELIDFSARYTADSLPCAQIIMKQFSDYEHSFLIDYGSVHGAEVDMVAVYKNCILGRVCQVYPYYSKVICVSDPLCKIPVYCNRSHAKGIYEGMLNEYAGALQYVSHLDTLELDELVISSGEGVIFPQGFAVGKIHCFELASLHYDVVVKPLLSLKEIEYCCLLKKGAL